MAHTFPTVSTHNHIACFNCTQNLEATKPQESGFAPRHGEHKKWCDKCQMWTYYDVTKGAHRAA
jgi:hypothetical protein